MKQTEQQQGNEDLVLLIWQIEKLRRREGGCTMNELISEAKKNFEGIEQIKIKKIMKQTAVEWLYERLERIIPRTALYDIDKREYFQQAKEMEKQQKGYSEEEVLPLLEMLQKCKEFFLLKTDAKSEERADAIGQAVEDFNKLKNK
jgi:hypothetical protein